tara:strand:- start:221 stop:451 length:231 start_codon:yes stop_codon:yes gene_type:complete
MKTKIIFILLISLLTSTSILADEIDCSQFKKFSAKYIECNANKLKDNTNKKFEKSGIKDKFKKLKESKTLSDLIKD